MKVTVERLSESRVQLGIEIDDERLEQSLKRVTQKMARQVRIPGFRPGKAPRAVIERHVGREGLIREALNDLVPDTYNEALEAEAVDAIGQPDLEITQIDPPMFTATVPVRPTVDLGDYQSIRIERDAVEVTGEMVDEQIETLRRRHATYVPVERPAQWNDVLIADVEGRFTDDDAEFLKDEAAEFQLREDQPLVLPGLAEAFIGLNSGDESSVELTVPDEFSVEAYRGRVIHFTIKLQEVKEEQLPELDDDFAQLVNAEEFETLDALRERISADLETQLTNAAGARLQEAAVDSLLEGAAIEYPRFLVDREIDHMVQEMVGNDQRAFASHLQRIGRTEAEFRETFRESADLRVRRSLVLGQLQIDEDIDVDPEEVERELDEIVEPLGDRAADLREQLLANDGLEAIRQNAQRRKVLERLEVIVTGPGANGASPSDAEPTPTDTDPVEATPDDD